MAVVEPRMGRIMGRELADEIKAKISGTIKLI
jgi:hypothetical protein